MFAAQAIQCGDASVIVDGGMECMSGAPYLIEKARTGYCLGHGELVDSILRDGLTDAYSGIHMGALADRCAARYAFTRQQQDDFAAASYRRALAAAAQGVFAREIVPVNAPAGKGTVTAGNASGISDGAAAAIVLSADNVKAIGIKPIARILGYVSISHEPEWFTLAPIEAIAQQLKQLSLNIAVVGLFEINEAFAVVVMAAMKELSIPHEKVNVHGGAVALGHPIGASGARTLVTLLNAMNDRGVRIGITSLCIGGGEAVAMAVEICQC